MADQFDFSMSQRGSSYSRPLYRKNINFFPPTASNLSVTVSEYRKQTYVHISSQLGRNSRLSLKLGDFMRLAPSIKAILESCQECQKAIERNDEEMRGNFKFDDGENGNFVILDEQGAKVTNKKEKSSTSNNTIDEIIYLHENNKNLGKKKTKRTKRKIDEAEEEEAEAEEGESTTSVVP